MTRNKNKRCMSEGEEIRFLSRALSLFLGSSCVKMAQVYAESMRINPWHISMFTKQP